MTDRWHTYPDMYIYQDRETGKEPSVLKLAQAISVSDVSETSG